MDKRFLLFLVIAALIMIVTPKLFPPARVPARTAKGRADTALVDSAHRAAVADTAGRAVAAAPVVAPAQVAAAAALPAHGDTIVVQTPRVRYRFGTLGASPLGAALMDYRALTKGGSQVELARPGFPLVTLGLLSQARDTTWLDRVAFTADSSALHETSPVLRFRGVAGSDTVAIAYTFSPDSYLVRVAGTVTGPGPNVLLLAMREGLRSSETDTVEDARHLSYVAKPMRDDPTDVDFRKLDPGQTRLENGPLDWVASKNKYFLVVAMSDTARAPFAGALLEGLPRPASKEATRASAIVVQPLVHGEGTSGAFAFTLYTGPQEWRRLLALGHDLENVNPYGGWFRGIIQPAATLLMRILLWAHDRFHVNYGWVVVVFGVALRLLLWPLNQSAMRAQLKVQRIQPELQAIQKRYKNTPDKLTAEMTRVYREHGMSPFSPLAGCLPMLIPMPVLYALYYVFQNTIEFRGVSFLWLADISQRDPYYILPIVMGVSMFLLSWIGLRVSPPNSQAKMMAYAMPVLMTLFFKNLAAGLNLYYAVQNIAALPQQWLIAQERAKVGVPATTAGPLGGSKKGEIGT